MRGEPGRRASLIASSKPRRVSAPIPWKSEPTPSPAEAANRAGGAAALPLERLGGIPRPGKIARFPEIGRASAAQCAHADARASPAAPRETLLVPETGEFTAVLIATTRRGD